MLKTVIYIFLLRMYSIDFHLPRQMKFYLSVHSDNGKKAKFTLLFIFSSNINLVNTF